MEELRVLSLEEAIEASGELMWMEFREGTLYGALPVSYHSERKPFLRFESESIADTWLDVRAEYYGMTWRCFNRRPACWEEDALPAWPKLAGWDAEVKA